MSKAKIVYGGSDSAGRGIEVAQRVDGVWFSREYSWNGYGMGWSKWAELKKVPGFLTQGTNAYSGESYPIEYGEVMSWGFSTLSRYSSAPKYRLPDA